MAFQKPAINKISTDIKDLTIYLRTIKKFGKSTLFRDAILAKYGDPNYGLSVSCGREKGEKLLDNLNVTHITTYKEAMELKDWLISEKGKEHNIEIISFDTVDELVPMFEKETIRISNLEDPKKKTSTINGAMGGYQAGQGFAAEMIKKYIDELTSAGFGVWAIAHTKFKNIKEKGGLEEDGYMQLTSNLVSAYEAAFGDIFDVTLTGVIDRDIEEKDVKVGTETKKKRYSTDTIRKLYFRGTPMIDAGGRFADGAVPEYLVFDKPNMGEDFIKTIENGMEKSKTVIGAKKTSNTETPKITKPRPVVKVEESIDEVIEDETVEEDISLDDTSAVSKEALIETIREKFKNAEKSIKVSVKEILNEKGNGKLDDSLDIETLEEINSML